MKVMKKTIYVLILPLVVVSGLVFTFAPFAYGSGANREIKNEIKPSPKSSALALSKDPMEEKKKWEASPDGISFKMWEASPEGKKIHASYDKIRKEIKTFTNMEGVVTSLSLPSGSRLGFGVMVRINGYDYILAFGPEKYDKNSFNFSKDFEQLHSLKVNDKIIIRSHSVSKAPKYSYPIISGDYIEQNGKVLFKRDFSKNDGC